MLNLYLVEGKTDISKLKRLGFHYVIKTNGTCLNTKTLEFLKLVEKQRKVVLVFDPDTPGKMLTSFVKQALTNYQVIKIDKTYAIKGKKLGVAETKEDYLLSKLQGCLNFDTNQQEEESISKEELLELQLSGSDSTKRKAVLAKTFHIETTSLKTIYEQLNILRLDYQTIKEELNKYGY